MIDYLTNTNFTTNTAKTICHLIKYYKGFTKDETPIEFKEIQEAVQNAFFSQLDPLPADPSEIPQENLQILPFELPIKQKSQTKAIVAGLHRIYNFDQLPEKYFETLDPIPSSIHELYPAIIDLFPITERSQLNNLAYFKKKLQDYYTCDSIPSSFFDLPSPKKPLPLAY
jgi:hypothetical protein